MSSCPRLQRLGRSICRQKRVQYDLTSTPLDRCLTTADLSLIAIGCMLGSGVYVLTGEVAGDMAGPAGTVSFLVSGLVALLAALCYMECATRLPETGASYLYAYVGFGEIFAFIIGWNAIILRVMSVALVSRGWSAYFDNVINHAVGNWTVVVVLDGQEWDSDYLGKYPDFLAAGISFLTCVLVAVGTSVSAKANGVFVALNVITISMVFVVAMIHSDISNLTTPYGYFPFGFNGVLTGAAASFSGYCGFEAVAFSAEEAKDPSRGLPIGVIMGFLVSMFCYCGAIFGLTIMVPFYEVNVESPFVSAFGTVGEPWMQYVVAIGALCSMTGGIINCMYCVSRSIYALARDGLLPKFLGYTHPVAKTPVSATIFGGAVSIIIAIIIDFVALMQFLSLVAFVEFVVVISACIMLRYRPQRNITGYSSLDGDQSRATTETDVSPALNGNIQNGGPPTNVRRGRVYHHGNSDETTPLLIANGNLSSSNQIFYHESMRLMGVSRPGPTVSASLIGFICFSSGAMILLTRFFEEISSANLPYICILAVLVLMVVVSCLPLLILPQYNQNISFKVPLMPYFPLASLLANIFLMVQFDAIAFIELAAWTAFGLIVYFVYGVRHSHENPANKHRVSQHADLDLRHNNGGRDGPLQISCDFGTSNPGSRRSSADNNAYWAGDSLITSSETSFAAH